MSTPDELVRRWFEEVWNQSREEAIDRLMDPAAKVHGLPSPSGDALRGPHGFKPLFRQFKGAFPDLRVEVLRTVVEGDLAVAHCRVTGTHRGGELGLEPTGRSVDFFGMVMVRVRGEVIGEGWNCFDFLTMYQQLGAVSAPGAASAP